MGSETKRDDGGMTGDWLLVRCADGRVMGDFEREADARVCERDCNADPDDDSLYIVARRSTPTPAADGEVDSVSLNEITPAERAARDAISRCAWEMGHNGNTSEELDRRILAFRAAALRARPLPDDVRAVVASQDAHTLCVVAVRDEIARRKFSGSAFSADEMVSTVLRTLLAHLQRTEGK